jgi:hypothetical protein
MAVPSANAFLLRFPEFGISWGDAQTDAVSYLAAHLLATRITQIGLQIEAKSGSPTGDGLSSTMYGQEYKRLLESRPISGFAL